MPKNSMIGDLYIYVPEQHMTDRRNSSSETWDADEADISPRAYVSVWPHSLLSAPGLVSLLWDPVWNPIPLSPRDPVTLSSIPLMCLQSADQHLSAGYFHCQTCRGKSHFKD